MFFGVHNSSDDNSNADAERSDFARLHRTAWDDHPPDSGAGPDGDLAVGPAAADSLARPRPYGRRRILNRTYVAALVDEPTWTYAKIADSLAADGLEESEVHRRAVVLYVDQTLHLNQMYNRGRRSQRHETSAGLMPHAHDSDTESQP